MNPGRLNKRVDIQTNAVIDPDPNGHEAPAIWQTIATRWARISPRTGRERLHAEQVQADVTHEVEIRPFPGLSPTAHRLSFKGRVLELVSVINPGERGESMLLMCKEAVVDG